MPSMRLLRLDEEGLVAGKGAGLKRGGAFVYFLLPLECGILTLTPPESAESGVPFQRTSTSLANANRFGLRQSVTGRETPLNCPRPITLRGDRHAMLGHANAKKLRLRGANCGLEGFCGKASPL
jgi:hypothetical protein